MSTPLWHLLLGVGPAERVRRARSELAHDRARLRAHLDADTRAFESAMDARAEGPNVLLGTCPPGVPYRVTLAALDGAHAWWSAGTGSGKSRGVGAFLAALLLAIVRGARLAVICLALQGDLIELVLRALGGILRVASTDRQRALLSHLLVARFFHGETLPPFNIFARAVDVPLLAQAQTLAEVLEHSLGAALGSRQETAATMLFALALEAGLPVNALRLMLHDRSALLALSKRSSEPLVRAYFEQRFARESAATVDGLASRLDRLLTLDAGLRGALASPGAIDWVRCFSTGSVSLFDLSRSPLGGDGARRALGALTIHSLVAAALSSTRRIEGPTIFVIDEAQLALTPATATTLATALTAIRGTRVGIHCINQSLAQLPREFVQLLATNVTWRLLGRSGATDASLSAEFLPRTGRVPKARAPFGPPGERVEYRSRSEEEAYWIGECGALPRRTFFVTERGVPFGTRRLVTPVFDPPALSTLPLELRAALERGSTGVPRRDLIARASEVEAETLARLAASPGEDGEPLPQAARRPRPRSAAPSTPDAVAAAARWGARGRRTP